MSDNVIIPPPSTHAVDFERKPILYQADGTALVRPVGFASSKTLIRPVRTTEQRTGDETI